MLLAMVVDPRAHQLHYLSICPAAYAGCWVRGNVGWVDNTRVFFPGRVRVGDTNARASKKMLIIWSADQCAIGMAGATGK